MSSLWHQGVKFSEKLPIQANMKADVVVIGGGLVGVLTAFLLQEKGVKVIILTRESVGSGQCGNCTGIITAQHGLIYQRLWNNFGEIKAREYAEENLYAVEQYKSLIQQWKIPCDFEEKTSYVYGVKSYDELILEWKTCISLGIKCSYLPRLDLPFQNKGGICLEGQGQFQPLKFLQYLTELVEFYPNSAVTSIKDNTLTVNGVEVDTEAIVFASCDPFSGNNVEKMWRNRFYVAAFPRENVFHGMYVGSCEDELSFRNYEKFALISGMISKKGENGRKIFESTSDYCKVNILSDESEREWMDLKSIKLEGVPYIGGFSQRHPNRYVATRFGRWGITNSMVAAQRISNEICGKNKKQDSIFSMLRGTEEVSKNIGGGVIREQQ